MSVLIPNIKIPDHCWECPLMSHLLCGYSKEIIPGTKKRDDCPLVELPPHGRLIDADALFNNLERTGWYDNADRDIAEDLVLAAPTIIDAEDGE